MARRRLTISDEKSMGIVQNSATYLVSNLCNAAIPLLLLPILTRYLGTAEYGQIAMFQTVLGAFAALVGLNVVGAANRKAFDTHLPHDVLARFIGACVHIVWISTLVVLLLVYVMRMPLAAWLGLPLHWLLAAVLVSAGTVLVNLRLGQWQVTGHARRYGMLQVGQTLANMLLSLLFVLVFLWGAAGRIGAQVLVVPACALLSLVLLHRDRLLSMRLSHADVREALAFGVPLVPHVAGLFVLNAADRLVINRDLGLAQAGIYMVAVQVTMAMALVFDAINRAYVPWLFARLAEDDPAQKRRIVYGTWLGFAGALGLAGVAFALGPPVTRWLAGDAFDAAGALIGWLALGQAFSGMYLLVTNYAFFARRTGLLSMATVAASLLHIGLLVTLVPVYGIKGAAWSFVVAMAMRFLLTWAVAQKTYPIPWFNARKIGSAPESAE